LHPCRSALRERATDPQPRGQYAPPWRPSNNESTANCSPCWRKLNGTITATTSAAVFECLRPPHGVVARHYRSRRTSSTSSTKQDRGRLCSPALHIGTCFADDARRCHARHRRDRVQPTSRNSKTLCFCSCRRDFTASAATQGHVASSQAKKSERPRRIGGHRSSPIWARPSAIGGPGRWTSGPTSPEAPQAGA
jgi:hypothetical protein